MAAVVFALLGLTSACGGHVVGLVHPTPDVGTSLPSLASAALAIELGGPRGGQAQPMTSHGYCSYRHSVACWQARGGYPAVLAEMQAQLIGLHVGRLTRHNQTAPAPTADSGMATLDLVDGARHVQMIVGTNAVGHVGAARSTGLQTVVVIADPA